MKNSIFAAMALSMLMSISAFAAPVDKCNEACGKKFKACVKKAGKDEAKGKKCKDTRKECLAGCKAG